MAEAKSGKGGVDGDGEKASVALKAELNRPRIRLLPVGNSDRPVVTNHSRVIFLPEMAFIDFGFLEPSLLAGLSRRADQGEKLPVKLNGRLAVRVAMGYDSLATLHRQIERILVRLRQRRFVARRRASEELTRGHGRVRETLGYSLQVGDHRS